MNNDAKQWMKRRVQAVKEAYSTYDCLTENGVELIDGGTNLQISCPFHNDKTPSARYYGADSDPHFHCWTCKLHLDSLNLYMKFKDLEFKDALSQLERRFGISVPQRPDPPQLDELNKEAPDGWGDVPRLLEILERKLMRLRDRVPLTDFVKFCRVLDAVRYDFDKIKGDPPPEMSIALNKLRDMMDRASST